jgi:hypothetical protein
MEGICRCRAVSTALCASSWLGAVVAAAESAKAMWNGRDVIPKTDNINPNAEAILLCMSNPLLK